MIDVKQLLELGPHLSIVLWFINDSDIDIKLGLFVFAVDKLSESSYFDYTLGLVVIIKAVIARKCSKLYTSPTDCKSCLLFDLLTR